MSISSGQMFYIKRHFCLAVLLVVLSFFPQMEGWGKTSQDQESKSSSTASKETQEKEQEKLEIVKTEYKQGMIDFKAKRYRDALQRFVRVYRLKPHPNLVYNMARSFEQLKEYNSAAEYYQKYLDINPKADDREQVEITITTMKKLAQEHPNTNTVLMPAKEDRLMKRIGWGATAFGTVLIIGGAVFGVKALGHSQELTEFKEGDSLQAFNRTAQQRDQMAGISDIFTLTGVSLTSLGLYFALRPTPTKLKSNEQSSVSLSIMPNGLSIQGAF